MDWGVLPGRVHPQPPCRGRAAQPQTNGPISTATCRRQAVVAGTGIRYYVGQDILVVTVVRVVYV
ncbi:hypothetical protein [Streptomyces sp. NPDC059142]|uniref:hypothetical protein n=1 Tax=unclassified Streptomyces TaxID=2593676 RepID=UPI0036B48D84